MQAVAAENVHRCSLEKLPRRAHARDAFASPGSTSVVRETNAAICEGRGNGRTRTKRRNNACWHLHQPRILGGAISVRSAARLSMPIHAATVATKRKKELVIADNVQKHGAERKRVAAKSCGEDERRNTVTSNCNGARFYQLWGPLGVDRDFRLAWRVKNRRAVCLRARKMQRI